MALQYKARCSISTSSKQGGMGDSIDAPSAKRLRADTATDVAAAVAREVCMCALI